MIKKPKKKTILYIIGSTILILIAAYFLFTEFYLNDYIASRTRIELQEGVRKGMHGRYELQLGKIKYSSGTFMVDQMHLSRLRYDSSESGIVIKDATLENLKITGVSLWALIMNEPLSMNILEATDPIIHLTDVAKEKITPDTVNWDTEVKKKTPVISFDSIICRKLNIFMPEKFGPVENMQLKDISVWLVGFKFDPSAKQDANFIYSQRAEIRIPEIEFPSKDSLSIYSLKNIHAGFSHSILRIDSFSYRSKLSDDAFSARHKYQAPKFDLRFTKIAATGIDWNALLGGKAFRCHKINVGSWLMDSYVDRRKVRDPRKVNVMLPNDLFRSLEVKCTIDSLHFGEGKVVIRERNIEAVEPGVLQFTHTNISVSPITNDSTDARIGKPSHISVRALFLGEAQLSIEASYPLLHRSFDMDVKATLSGFNVKKLNTWLVPFEKIEVTDGVLESGNIDMKIRNGTATTSVTPRYHDLSLKMLNPDAHKSRGILEGIKTLFANIFVVKSNNLDKKGKSAKSATESLTRLSNQEFMEFLWASLRRSLGDVVGGFK